mgnify:CR=1 FL=1
MQNLIDFDKVMTVRIEYSDHLKFRLKVRRISRLLPEMVLRQADDYFYDTVTKLLIAVKEIADAKRSINYSPT